MSKLFALWMLVVYPVCYYLSWRLLEREDNYLFRFVMSAVGGATVFIVLSVIVSCMIQAVKVLFA